MTERSSTMASTGFHRGVILETPHAQVRLKSRSIPTLSPNQVLVLNHAIASNPVDWIMQEYSIFISEDPIILGSDVCGTVSAVGSSVTKLSPGDRVCGFGAVICNCNIDHGAFQDYTVLRTTLFSTITPQCASLPPFPSSLDHFYQ